MVVNRQCKKAVESVKNPWNSSNKSPQVPMHVYDYCISRSSGTNKKKSFRKVECTIKTQHVHTSLFIMLIILSTFSNFRNKKGCCWPYMGTVSNSNKIRYVLLSVVGNVEYLGIVNNSNKTWYVLICVVYNRNKLKPLEILQLTHNTQKQQNKMKKNLKQINLLKKGNKMVSM